MSHSYMRLVPKRDPLKLTRQVILEEVQVRENHVVDVLPICHCIVAIGRDNIAR